MQCIKTNELGIRGYWDQPRLLLPPAISEIFQNEFFTHAIPIAYYKEVGAPPPAEWKEKISNIKIK